MKFDCPHLSRIISRHHGRSPAAAEADGSTAVALQLVGIAILTWLQSNLWWPWWYFAQGLNSRPSFGSLLRARSWYGRRGSCTVSNAPFNLNDGVDAIGWAYVTKWSVLGTSWIKCVPHRWQVAAALKIFHGPEHSIDVHPVAADYHLNKIGLELPGQESYL